MDVQIRPMSPEDVRGYHACLDAVARERKYLAFLEAPPLEACQAWVEQGLRAGNPHYVAVCGGRVVGWCDLTRNSLVGFTHSGKLGMGVFAEYRRRGIGERLITAALERAREIGLERVELGVFASNVAAKALYAKVGFVTEGVKRGARRIDGSYDDLVEMAIFPVDADTVGREPVAAVPVGVPQPRRQCRWGEIRGDTADTMRGPEVPP